MIGEDGDESEPPRTREIWFQHSNRPCGPSSLTPLRLCIRASCLQTRSQRLFSLERSLTGRLNLDGIPMLIQAGQIDLAAAFDHAAGLGPVASMASAAKKKDWQRFSSCQKQADEKLGGANLHPGAFP